MAAKLRIKLTENLGFVPPLLGYLANISEFAYGYKHYRLRHPGGIFTLRLAELATDLLDLTTYIQTFEGSDSAFGDRDDLVRRLSRALFSFANYYNAAFDIILGCCEPQDNVPSRDVWKWLKEHGYKAESVYKGSLSESHFFTEIVNELKHSSKRFGTVLLKRNVDGVRVAGYYLEAVDENGAIVPDPRYHGEVPSANSFNLDLRKLYYLLYKVADVLYVALQQHFADVYSSQLEFDSERTADDKVLESLYKAIVALPLTFLPNERSKKAPVPRVAGKGKHRVLFFESQSAMPPPSSTYEVNTVFPPSDGFSRSFGMPYHRIGGT